MQAELILMALVMIGIVGRSSIIATAASVLLIIKLLRLDAYLPLVERRGLELGLLFLTMAVLVPFALEKVTWKDVLSMFTSPPGILAIVGGALATFMNGKGLALLQWDPQIIVGLVIGSIFGILFLKGIPVGPLMAAGITAILVKLFQWMFPS